jgi:hypothetical protein
MRTPIRDFVHCRFADAGRRWVWLRSPRPASANLHNQRRKRLLDRETIAGLLLAGLLTCLLHRGGTVKVCHKRL